MLGSGNFGKVFQAHHISNNSFKVAIKAIQKKKVKEQLLQIKDEIKILAKLDHPNICKYYETYESPKLIFLVMEYCSGQDLFNTITNTNKIFSEK